MVNKSLSCIPGAFIFLRSSEIHGILYFNQSDWNKREEKEVFDPHDR